MPANNRIYYASQAVTLTPQNSDGSVIHGTTYVPQGLQSVGMTTNFNLEQVFQLGQLELYDNLENVPEVEVTLNKVLDGTPPLYLMCMGGKDGLTGANDKDLAEVATNRVNFKLGIYKDTVTAASGAARHWVACSGMYLSSFNYTFPVEGNSTEEVTLVGNNKVWNSGILGGAPNLAEFNRGTVPGSSPSREGFGRAPSITRRYNINMTETVLPTGIGGIPLPSGDAGDALMFRERPYINNISISSNLGREAIYELGRMAPYFRYVNFPVEVTSEFEVTASDGDTVNASDFSEKTGCGNVFQNVFDKPIKVVVCGSGTGDKLALDLGGKNKLTSVNYSGGDTGGGNATITYSFQTFNAFKMVASGTYLSTAWIDNTADQTNYF